MADDKKNLKPDEQPKDEQLQDEQLSKVNGGGSIIDEILRVLTGRSG